MIKPIADLGVLLLLFTIGLKLNLKELAAPQVWAVTGLHMLLVVPATATALLLIGLLIPALNMGDMKTVALLAFALSFSSTVFAVKIFDERGEGNALHASIAISILVVQDIVCLLYTSPSPRDATLSRMPSSA